MFRPIHHLLAKLRKAKAVRRASVLRAEARARVADAEMRRDDRDLGRARMQLELATREALRVGA